MCRLLGYLHPEGKIIDRLFMAFAFAGLYSDISLLYLMYDFNVLKDPHEGLDPFGLKLLKQVALLLPLQPMSMKEYILSVYELALGL